MADKELSEYEKRRLENIKENNEILRSLGLFNNKPTATVNNKKRKKKRRKKYTGSSDSSSEDEWMPGLEEVNYKTIKKAPVLKPEVRKPLTRIVSEANKKVTTALLNKEPRLPRKCKKGPTQTIQVQSSDLPDWLQSSEEEEENNFEGFTLEEVLNDPVLIDEEKKEKELYKEFYDQFGETDEENENDFDGFKLEEIKEPVNLTVPEERRYPKRRVEEIKYTEVELSDEDEYLFCEDCDEIHHGDCPVHGPLLTLDPTTGYDQESTNYTSVLVPKELTVKPSTIPNAGLGVFATQPIPKGVRFGPYKGQKVYGEDIDEGENTSYMWEVKRGSESYFIDGQVESESNWMRFINCARNEEEQNLVAFQYHGEIYYRSFKSIYPGNELFVWYGDQYAKELGISTAFEKDDDSQTFICKNCESSFVAQSSFNLHLRHNKSCFDANPQIFSCLRCGESFARLHLLQHHIRKHEEEKPNTKTVIVESVHVNESFEDYDKACPYCGKEFLSKNYLKIHMRTHTGDKPYKCQYCGKGFSRDGNLTTHIRTHTGDKPYKCQYCGKGFNQDSNLKRHIRTHTGDKPYKCQYCGKGFNQDSILKRHIRTHTGDKPYKCQYCGKGFSTNGDLKTHIRTHTGDKPYKCQYCGKEFNQDSILKRHIRTHTGDKPYKCQYCGKGFSQSHHLKTHKCCT